MRHLARCTLWLVVLGIVATSCSSDSRDVLQADLPTTAVDTTTTVAPTTAAPATTIEEDTTMTSDPPNTDPPAPDEARFVCETLSDFESPEFVESWAVVNDNVMGGRSLGDRTFDEGTMVFAGEINTDGGGFSSLRLPLDQGEVASATHVRFTARSDGRNYMVTFDDALPERNRRVSFRAPIEFEAPGEWETVDVDLNELYPAVFGNPIVDEPFRRDLATRVGIMLSDGLDGPFRLELDSIAFCTRL